MKTPHLHHHIALAVTLLFATPWAPGISQSSGGTGGQGGSTGSQGGSGRSTGGTSGTTGQSGSTNRPNSGPQSPGTTRPNPAAPQQPGINNPNTPQQPGTVNPNAPQQPGTGQVPNTQQPGANQNPNFPQQPGANLNPNMPQQPGTNPNPNTPLQPGTTPNPNLPQQPGTPGAAIPGANTPVIAVPDDNAASTGAADTRTRTSAGVPVTGTNPNQGVPAAPGSAPAMTITPPVDAATAGGTITSFRPDGFSLLTSPDGTTANFRTAPGTTFMDSEGRTIPKSRFTPTTPAMVFFIRSGTELVATKVVAKEGTGVFTAGTVTEVSPGIVVVKLPDASPTPVRYVNNETTNYVDENGQPVPASIVKAGMPVKVYYTKVGDTLVASKIEVQGGDGGIPKPTIDEANTTTTTTIIKKEAKP